MDIQYAVHCIEYILTCALDISKGGKCPPITSLSIQTEIRINLQKQVSVQVFLVRITFYFLQVKKGYYGLVLEERTKPQIKSPHSLRSKRMFLSLYLDTKNITSEI